MINAKISGAVSTLAFGEIVRDRQRVLTPAAHIMGAIVMIGFFGLLTESSPRALGFLEMGATLWLVFEWWAHCPKKALPILPVLLLPQGLFFLMPILAKNPVLDDYQLDTFNLASMAVVVYFVAAWAGWFFSVNLLSNRRSRFNFDFSNTGGAVAGMKLGLVFLGLNLLLYGLTFTGQIWSLIRGDQGLFSILRSLADICGLGGAFFGGLLINRKELGFSLKILFWAMLGLVFMFNMAGLLLFGVVIIIASFSLGVLMGGGVPWKFLLTVSCLLAFLNFGKFPMRAKYLDENGAGQQVTLTGLPAYYLEWANESLRLMGMKGVGTTDVSIVNQGEQGQPLFYRMDQMGSLLFITEIMKREAIQPLDGATYTLIPPLLIPRFFWPDKPIAHGGQVLLNIYFGRQQTLEQTEKTFIAWGWLPEGIGNFGIWRGAVFIGLVLGFMCGLAEGWSYSVRMLSVEGFVLLVFFMSVANSYEMAASIFVTMAFQSTCSVLAGGCLIYMWLGRASRQGVTGAYSKGLRPRRLKPATPTP